ncbi:MAG TPA: hypothetical protein VFD92_00835 [Candidatus Binatia bacterium]|nr:hypothetical protein [Candidatus Binatia bacterium]
MTRSPRSASSPRPDGSTKTLAPSLCEWRAELAAVLGDEAARVERLSEAQQLYEQIGAPLQAERIGQLSSEPTS